MRISCNIEEARTHFIDFLSLCNSLCWVSLSTIYSPSSLFPVSSQSKSSLLQWHSSPIASVFVPSRTLESKEWCCCLDKDEPTSYGRQYFPLAAVIGQDAIKTALLLGAINREIEGIIILGKRGTVKTVMARGLHAILSPIEVVVSSIANVEPACPEE
ncbi:hypothetical protein LOK49_LG05G03022 [Camellia lanceoleosa]|uniref:Uncharacterized protein n=1 Tax=Camellia lanceoleosa TaxID=1840588 RepID=A0ACC0HT52_9ERIC|nr:hypothetical protein LOK49_LG05G03022 [Camellia lanceoleosa]